MELHDPAWSEKLERLPAYQAMRKLSIGFEIVSVEAGTRVVCRDLRTRNFKTEFGCLEVFVDADGTPRVTSFHV